MSPLGKNAVDRFFGDILGIYSVVQLYKDTPFPYNKGLKPLACHPQTRKVLYLGNYLKNS